MKPSRVWRSSMISKPPGIATAMVQTVSKTVMPTPCASAQRYSQITLQSYLMPRSSRPTQEGEPAINSVDAAWHGEQQQKIDHHGRGEDLDRPERLRGDGLGLVHVFGNG